MRRVGAQQSVGVWCAGTWEREAMTTWVRRLGYPVVAVDSSTTFADLPDVVLVSGRDRAVLHRLPWIGATRVVVLGGRAGESPRPGIRNLVDGPDVAERLRVLLETLLGPSAGRVALSVREREILTTYVLGATVEETAAEHFVATSTVRTHYRRVTARYTDAGWPVANKAQLLLRMVAEGWIRLDEDPAPPGPATHELRRDAGAA